MLGRLLLLGIAAAIPVIGQGKPAAGYVDPSQIDLPWPYYSFIRQPWRSYLEVVPARTYLDGLGVVWSATPPGRTADEVAAELAWAGFRRVRFEIPWSAVRWDEGGLRPEVARRVIAVLEAFKAHGLRPLILLNANHGAPCPMQVSRWRLAQAALPGARAMTLQTPVVGIVAGHSEVLTLGSSEHAGPLITGVSSNGGVSLSKAIDHELPAGSEIQIGTLKYLPLGAVGTPEFEQTAAGWLRYLDLVTRLVLAHYGADFDLELWNELTFGSDFLSLDNYYDATPRAARADLLHSGGSAWELARRSVLELTQLAPRARPIWGFSNTTAFHTPIRDLPAGMQGQSYHPYGTGPRCYSAMAAGRESYNAGGFVPAGCAVMPEGWGQTFQQTESLIRLLTPTARAEHPPGVGEFQHYITEHGIDARALGITTPGAARAAKQKFLLRAPVFWLNKGLTGLYVYNAWEGDELSFGMLSADGSVSPALTALHRMVECFSGAVATGRPRPIEASVTRVAGPGAVYANDPGGKRVKQEQTAALLPFQLDAHRFDVVVYVMTEDFPRDLAEQSYRIALSGLVTQTARVRYYDPLSGRWLRVQVLSSARDRLAVEVALTDSPRVLEVDAS